MNELGGGRKEGQVWQRLARGRSRAVSVEIKNRIKTQVVDPLPLKPPQEPSRESPKETTRESPSTRPQTSREATQPSPQSPPRTSARPPFGRGAATTERHRPPSIQPSPPRPAVTAPANKSAAQSKGDHPRTDKAEPRKWQQPPKAKKTFGEERRIKNKLTISEALSDEEEHGRSLAALRRARIKEREQQKQEQQKPTKAQSRLITLPEVITVADLANRMAERSAEVVKRLLKLGAPATVNETIDADVAELVAQDFGHSVKRVRDADVETDILTVEKDDPSKLVPRPPVVSVMGHVDHGKTSLLDALRKTSLADKEAGGITQHIGAYQAEVGGKRVTFIDTPGHRAFTKMRARGALATDIVALVVAADDGVKEQTVESIKHAKLAKTPMVVVVNKIDAPAADPNKVYTQLLEHEVVVEPQGGETLAVEVSAKEGKNLDKLPEALLLQAELMELKANPNVPPTAVVLEAGMDIGRGPMATVIVKSGTLKKGDVFVAGSAWGRVRALLDWQSKPMDKAMPGQPARIQGFITAPEAGDDFAVVASESKAREIHDYRKRRGGEREIRRLTLEEQLKQSHEDEKINIVIKADTHGSLEALCTALEALGSEQQTVNILYRGIGDVNESDADLASLSKGFVVAFAVRVNKQAQEQIKRHNIFLSTSTIIYEAEKAVKEHLELLQKGSEGEAMTELGKAEVLQVFDIGKFGKIAGCRITEGKVKAGCIAKVKRLEEELFSGKLSSLKQEKSKVGEIGAGRECGLRVGDFEDYRQGDIIEFYTQG